MAFLIKLSALILLLYVNFSSVSAITCTLCDSNCRYQCDASCPNGVGKVFRK